jgi:putative Holliday junction resolvase
LGLRRIGLALSDEGEKLATPLKALSVGSVRQAPAAVAEVIREVGAGAVVVGAPLGLEGEENRPEVVRARRFASAIRRETGLPVHLVDESLSTREAEERAGARGRAANAGTLHAAAAAVILQRWLDRPPGGAPRAPDGAGA